MLRASVERNDLPLLSPEDFEDAVRLRMRTYEAVADGREIAVFINVGGGTASVGTHDDKRDFRPGLNTRVPVGLERTSVMRTFLERGTPVIHVSQIRSLARRYGLADMPEVTPEVGEGAVFHQETIARWTTLIVLLGLLLAMFIATRFDVVSSLIRRDKGDQQPEQMV